MDERTERPVNGRVVVVTGRGATSGRWWRPSPPRPITATSGRGEHRGIVVTCDVVDPAALGAVDVQVERALGAVDVRGNNAGAVTPLGPTAQIDVGGWVDALAIILTDAFVRLRTALPSTLARRWGRIVNVSTVTAAAASLRTAGREMRTANLAVEVAGGGVNMQVVWPGVVHSAMPVYVRSQWLGAGGDAFVTPLRALKETGRRRAASLPAPLIAHLVAPGATGEIANITNACESEPWDVLPQNGVV